MIVRAKHSQIDEILEVTKACAQKMISDGIYQWNEVYPSLEKLRTDIDRGELYVIFGNTERNNTQQNSIIGCVVISTKMDEEYKSVNWLVPTSDHYYIHRLAVHPNFQGKGIARKLMDFAENRGLQNNIVSIRLDTFSQNLRNQKFYNNRGYQRLENIFFPNQSEFPFYCYELILTTGKRILK